MDHGTEARRRAQCHVPIPDPLTILGAYCDLQVTCLVFWLEREIQSCTVDPLMYEPGLGKRTGLLKEMPKTFCYPLLQRKWASRLESMACPLSMLATWDFFATAEFYKGKTIP